jgi:hypothetical protein
VNAQIRTLHRPACLRIHAAFFANPFLNTRINAHAADDSFRSLLPSGTGNRKAPGGWQAFSLRGLSAKGKTQNAEQTELTALGFVALIGKPVAE